MERNSIRATVRITNVSKPTILKLLADLGQACVAFQDEAIRNVRTNRVQIDEIWQFVYAEAKNVRPRSAARSARATCGRG